MAVVQMNKVTLLGLADDKRRILSRLIEIGVVEIEDIELDDEYKELFNSDVNKDNISVLDYKINKLSNAIDVLKTFDERKKPLFAVRTTIEKHKYKDITIQRQEVLKEVDKVLEIKEKISDLKNQKNKLEVEMTYIKPWNTLDFPLELTNTKTTSIFKGTIPSIGDINHIIDQVSQISELSHIDIVNQDNEQYYITVYIYKEVEKEALQLLKKNGFTPILFKNAKGEINTYISENNNRIKEIEDKIDSTSKELKDYVAQLSRMEIVFDYYSIRKELATVEGKIKKSNRVFIIKGWMPEKLTQILFDEFNEKWTIDITFEKPEEDEQFPILLENKFIADSTQGITEMYSLPNSLEADPNSLMAPFFIMFFGLMLSDAGYGLIIALACGLVYFKMELEDNTKRFIKMLMLCGVATIFWGIMLGSFFGNLIPIFMGDPTKDVALWFNPVNSTETFLMWSLIFGVIHLYAGLGMRAWNFIRRKKYVAVLFDVVSWYVFFTGFLIIILPYVPGVPESILPIAEPYGLPLFAIGAIILLLTQGRAKKGILGKIVGGVASLYDVVNFLSDVLSYSRLMAMGLATGIIATIINNLASMNGFSVFGVIIFIIIFTLGHAFNLGINALGAYVNSIRLQYVEFFGKFYEGGGKAFTPFERNTKYVKIKN